MSWGLNDYEYEGNEFDEEEFDSKFPYWMNKDSIIFLIDASREMFEPNDSGEIPFHNSIRAAISVITNKIISSDSDLLALCFYKTREKKNTNDCEGVYISFDLDQPDVSMITNLEKLLTIDFESEYGHYDKEFYFGDALWACSTIFSNCTTKVGHKRIFLFTNDDEPHPVGSDKRETTIRIAHDLAESGIEIELFSMNKKDQLFDFKKFFKHIITVDIDEITGEPKYDGASKFEELKMRVRRKEFKKRSLGKLSFKIGELEIAVRLYNIIQEAKKSAPKRLYQNKPVRTVTKRICEETNSILLDSQILYGYEYSGKLLKFDKEEARSMKIIDEPGIVLLGFKPRDRLKDYHNLKYPSFIYPDEASISGSTVLFSALLDRMIHHNKIAICKITPRSNAPCRFVALLPSKEYVDNEGIQVIPPGFNIVWLPFAEDIKDIPFEEMEDINNDDVENAKSIIKAFQIKFDPRNFENPVLQTHHAYLNALALDKTEEEMEEVIDYLQPDEEGMAKFSDLVVNFKVNIFPDTYTFENTNKKKRQREDSQPSSETKKKKITDDIDWKEMVETGKIGKLGVIDLREYCSQKGLKNYSKLKKNELVQLVTAHINGLNK